jgi:hypothetical protein
MARTWGEGPGRGSELVLRALLPEPRTATTGRLAAAAPIQDRRGKFICYVIHRCHSNAPGAARTASVPRLFFFGLTDSPAVSYCAGPGESRGMVCECLLEMNWTPTFSYANLRWVRGIACESRALYVADP